MKSAGAGRSQSGQGEPGPYRCGAGCFEFEIARWDCDAKAEAALPHSNGERHSGEWCSQVGVILIYR